MSCDSCVGNVVVCVRRVGVCLMNKCHAALVDCVVRMVSGMTPCKSFCLMFGATAHCVVTFCRFLMSGIALGACFAGVFVCQCGNHAFNSSCH